MDKGKKIKRYLWYLLIAFVFCLGTAVFMICNWAKSTFNVGLNAIINTLFAPLEGTSSTTVLPAVKYCLPPVLIVLVLCVLYCIWDKKRGSHNVRIAVSVLSVGYLLGALAYVQFSYDVIGYLKIKFQKTDIYEEEYVSPRDVVIQASGEQRNLLYIYLESMETTYSSIEEGGTQEVNYMPNLTQLAYDNISFSNSETLGGFRPISGASWTMSALFSSTSGVPFALPVGSNDMESETSFASGIYTLGDFLKDQGYHQEFLCGSDASFGGRRNYFLQHGNYDIFDLYTAREKGYIADDYYVWWGFEDEILYEIAKDELLRLSSEEAPFNLTMLTVDTHHIGGYQCSLCEDTYEDVTANVVACADEQLWNFIEWCKEQEFYENTTIVISGDHPRMDTHLVDGVNYDDRTIYNCFINSVYDKDNIDISNREFTAIDMLPTTLAAMGYTIEGERLGLGVNLFSDKFTLAEELGFDVLSAELEKSSSYYVDTFAPEFSYLVEDQEAPICTIYCYGENYNAESYISEGLNEAGNMYSWSEGNKVSVNIPIEEESADKLKITIHIKSTYGPQEYTIVQGDEEISTGSLDGYGNIEFEAKVAEGMCKFDVLLPGAVSPAVVEGSDDTRTLAIAISTITVNSVTEASYE